MLDLESNIPSYGLFIPITQFHYITVYIFEQLRTFSR